MRRRSVLWALKVAVSLGLLGWVLHRAIARDGVDALGARLGELSPGWIAVAIGVQLAAVGLGILRWRELLGARGLGLPFGFLVRTYLMGRFVGTFTPSTAGLDAWRAFEVARRTGDRGAAAGVLVVEKLVGLLGLSLACLALLPIGADRFFGAGALAAAMAIGAGAALGLAVLHRPATLAALVRRIPARGRGLAGRLASALGGEGLRPGVLARAVALSLAAHLLTSAVFVTTAAALGLASDPWAVLVVGNAIVVATLLPISVGGVGVREGVAVALLAAVAIGPADATLVALLGYLVGQVPGIAGGLLAVAKNVPEPVAIGTIAP